MFPWLSLRQGDGPGRVGRGQRSPGFPLPRRRGRWAPPEERRPEGEHKFGTDAPTETLKPGSDARDPHLPRGPGEMRSADQTEARGGRRTRSNAQPEFLLSPPQRGGDASKGGRGGTTRTPKPQTSDTPEQIGPRTHNERHDAPQTLHGTRPPTPNCPSGTSPPAVHERADAKRGGPCRQAGTAGWGDLGTNPMFPWLSLRRGDHSLPEPARGGSVSPTEG